MKSAILKLSILLIAIKSFYAYAMDKEPIDNNANKSYATNTLYNSALNQLTESIAKRCLTEDLDALIKEIGKIENHGITVEAFKELVMNKLFNRYAYNLLSKNPPQLYMFDNKDAGINSIAFGPNARSILIGPREGQTTLWDIKNLKNIQCYTLKHPTDEISAIDLNYTGKYALVGPYCSHHLQFWDLRDLRNLHCQILPGRCGGEVKFSPDGKYAISQGDDYNLKIWCLQNQNTENVCLQAIWEDESAHFKAFDPNGRSAILSSPNIGTYIKDLTDLNKEPYILKHANPDQDHVPYLLHCKYSPNGKYIVGCAVGKDKDNPLFPDDRILLYDVSDINSIKCYALKSLNSRNGISVEFGSDSKCLFDRVNGIVEVCDISDLNNITSFTIKDNGYYIDSIAFSPDRKHALILASNEIDSLSYLRLLDLGNLDNIKSISLGKIKHDESTVKLSPDGRLAFTYSSKGMIVVWDLMGNLTLEKAISILKEDKSHRE